jgi:hypothetical protein
MNIAFFVSAFCFAFCLFMFFYFKWYIKRRTAAEELLAEYRSEVYRLIAEIDSATDRDSLLVEDRIKTLKALLDDTDKRIAVYVRELDRSRTGEALYSSLGRGIRAALIPQAPAVMPAPPAGKPPAAVEAAPTAQPAPPAETVPEGPSKQQIRDQIAGLAGQGLSPAEIASRLNLSLSEVDLALNLLGRGSR